MLLRVLKKDLKKNKVLSVILILFVFLASMLTSGSIRVLTETMGAADAMFLAAKAPHLLQMHAGPADEDSILDFAETRPEIQDVQILPILQIPGSSLFLTPGQSEADGIMDISFVTQSPSFDFLLDLANQPAQIQPGEIFVPVYYLQKDDLKLGDMVLLKQGDWSTQLTIGGFLRDSAMNSSMASSKRFLISGEDYSALKTHFTESESLIEFRLTDPGLAAEVQTAYQAAGLPQKGPPSHPLYLS